MLPRRKIHFKEFYWLAWVHRQSDQSLVLVVCFQLTSKYICVRASPYHKHNAYRRHSFLIVLGSAPYKKRITTYTSNIRHVFKVHVPLCVVFLNPKGVWADGLRGMMNREMRAEGLQGRASLTPFLT